MNTLTFNLDVNNLGTEYFFEDTEKLLSFVCPVISTVDVGDDIFILSEKLAT